MILIKEVKTFRCESEDEATQLVETIKEQNTVKKSVITEKTKKSKGEIIEIFYLVEVTIVYEEA